ncbi:hypothetical protein Q8G81_35645, partial [Klebsiella pneumoniae]
MNENSGVLTFTSQQPERPVRGVTPSPPAFAFQPVSPEKNPYGQDSPSDIGEMLLPDGAKFGLF